MAKVRLVKPELFRHKGLFEAEMNYQLPLRFAFIGLFTCCDREGRFKWRPQHLKLDIFPYDNIDILLVLEALVECGFVCKYEYQGEWYGCIPSWLKHQRIVHHEMQSVIPDPLHSLIKVTKTHAQNNAGTTIFGEVETYRKKQKCMMPIQNPAQTEICQMAPSSFSIKSQTTHKQEQTNMECCLELQLASTTLCPIRQTQAKVQALQDRMQQKMQEACVSAECNQVL